MQIIEPAASGGPLHLHTTTTTRAGICAGTHVMTLDGHRPVQALQNGDRVITRDGTRGLRALHCFRLADRPIRVRRGALGPDRPISDLYLGPDQAIRLRDWQGETSWGADLATMPVKGLVAKLRLDRPGGDAGGIVYQLEFNDIYTFYAEGLEVVSHLPDLALAVGAA